MYKTRKESKSARSLGRLYMFRLLEKFEERSCTQAHRDHIILMCPFLLFVRAEALGLEVMCADDVR